MAAGRGLRGLWRGAPAAFALVIITALIWVVSVASQWSSALVVHAAFLPERMMGLPNDDLLVPAWLTPVTTLFVHAGFLHLAINLLALGAFGRSVEPAIGSAGLVLLYILGGATAAGTFFLVHPAGLPWVGAGGGASAVMGAYAMLFGRNRAGSKARMPRWSYTLWLCAGWTLVSLLVLFTFVDVWAVYYAPAYLASFAIGLPLGRLLLLFRYRNA